METCEVLHSVHAVHTQSVVKANATRASWVARRMAAVQSQATRKVVDECAKFGRQIVESSLVLGDIGGLSICDLFCVHLHGRKLE